MSRFFLFKKRGISGRGVLFLSGISHSGTIETLLTFKEDEDILKENITRILLTTPGERVWLGIGINCKINFY